MTAPTYARHPLDKRRPAPHLVPRSPKRRRREQRVYRVLVLLAQVFQDAVHVCQDDFALAPPRPAADPIHSRAVAAALGPDPRQETRP